ncbi:hypothetical protein MGU_11366 [Metarhizium guizhouense ARSEF 977]|uniref:Uncharacterized protein n=1 Tax=Metarhizium guizhouense (strain ARSEF 977) TaxID=1276136 RepID=A0A0B4GUT6_METGA|nr:hypothetical protein MGU_11366 [Metarhizium guizhouense ARSEF 977]
MLNPRSIESIEKVCGTRSFCETFDPAEITKQEHETVTKTYGFANMEECLAAHAPEPSGNVQSTSTEKLPWFTDKQYDHGRCVEALTRIVDPVPPTESIEKVCGTKPFCETWNPEFSSKQELETITKKYGFANMEECLAAHAPEPSGNVQSTSTEKLPWFTDKQYDHGRCVEALTRIVDPVPPTESIEKVCGTKPFCETWNPEFSSKQELETITKKYGFANMEECLAAHAPEPSGNVQSTSTEKLPWFTDKQYDHGRCVEALTRIVDPVPPTESIEKVCGTKPFCETWNPEFSSKQELETITKKYGFANMEECLAAHAPEPSGNVQSTSTEKLPWVTDKQYDHGRCLDALQQMLNPRSIESIEKVCGTRSFCETFDPAEITKQEHETVTKTYGFANSEFECLWAHFNPHASQ